MQASHKPPGEGLRPASFAEGPFRPHGDFDLLATGQTARSVSRGPFNAELMIAASKARRAVFQQLGAKGPFGVITAMHDSVLCPLEALTLMTSLLHKEVEEGVPMPAAFAWVLPDSVEGKRIMAPRFTQAYCGAGINFRIFDAQDQAEQWVAEILERS